MTQTPNQTQQWNPDEACEEMAELFRQVDEIFQQSHYQEDVSTKDLARPGADLFPTERNERQGV